MKYILTYATVICLYVVCTATAQATVLRLPHKPFSTMTRQEKIHYLKRQRWHDESIIRWWTNHRELANGKVANDLIWASKSLKIVNSNLRKLMGIRTVQVSGNNVPVIICTVFGAYSCPVAKAIAWRESRYEIEATNGTHWGLFQLDRSALNAYARNGYSTVYEQVVAAHNMFLARGWEPWTCCE